MERHEIHGSYRIRAWTSRNAQFDRTGAIDAREGPTEALKSLDIACGEAEESWIFVPRDRLELALVAIGRQFEQFLLRWSNIVFGGLVLHGKQLSMWLWGAVTRDMGDENFSI